MKNTFPQEMPFRLSLKKLFKASALCLLLLLNSIVYSQIRPHAPAKQWQRSLNQKTYTTPGPGGSTDWTLDIIQTHDDSYIGVGFAGSYTADQAGVTCTVNYNPGIYKLTGGGSVIWKKIEDDGHPVADVLTATGRDTHYAGRFLKVIEIKEVGQNKYCYIAVGQKSDPTFSATVYRSFICKYDEDGNLIGSVHYINLNTTSDDNQLLASITHYVNNSGQDRYLFTGYRDNQMFLYQTDNSFIEQPLGSEVKGIPINDYLPGTTTPYFKTRGFSVKVSYTFGTKPNGEPVSSGIPVGIYVCGALTQGTYTYPGGTSATTQSDAYVCKYNLSGVKLWGNIFQSNSLDFDASSQSPSCLSNSTTPPTPILKNGGGTQIPSRSLDDAAYSMEESSNGNIIVAMMYHKSDCSDCKEKNYPSDPFYFNAISRDPPNHGYVDFFSADAYLVMVDPAGNQLNSPKYVCHISGDDMNVIVKQTYDMDGSNPNFVILATTANDFDQTSDPNSTSSLKISAKKEDFLLRKLSYTNSTNVFSVEWTKVFAGDGGGACGFALETTRDGGFLVAGNNGQEGDNHTIVKLSNDCQTRAFHNNILNDDGTNITLKVGQTLSAGTTIWSTPTIVNGTIIVGSGAILEINNTTVQFTAYSNIFDEYQTSINSVTIANHRSGIIVQPGGKLLVNGAILTNYDGCASYGFDNADRISGAWDGILLLGTPGAPMMTSGYENFFGIAQFTGSTTNPSVLKNARYGVTVGGGYGDGGIIKASYTTFLNNRKSVAFNYYQDPVYGYLNRSKFTDCIFLNDLPITGYSGRGTNQHLSAWGVRGINFADCSFNNTMLNNQICDLDRGVGIVTFDADITIGSYLVGGLPGPRNKMEGLRTGLQALNTGTSSPFYRAMIFDTDFKNVQEGIILENNVAPQIKCNTFLIDNDFKYTQRYLLQNPYGASASTAYAYGLYTTNTSAFHSVFNQFAFNNSAILSFGSITEHSGPGGDALNSEIKLHTINNNNNSGNMNHYGMEAIGQNGGLAVSCNTYLNLQQDWLIDVNEINPPSPTTCVSDCFPPHFFINISSYDPMNVFSINRAGTTQNIESNYKFTYYWKYSNTTPVGFTLTYPTLINTNNQVACDYTCDGISIVDPTEEGKRLITPSKNSIKADTLDLLWKQGKFEDIAKLLAKSENPLNQKLVNLYDLTNHTKLGKTQISNSFTNFIQKLPKERTNKLTDLEIDQLRNIAIAEPDYAIYAQNLISLNTGEVFKRLPMIAGSQAKNNKLNYDAVKIEDQILIYPNPANESVQVTLKNQNTTDESISIEIYDCTGKSVLFKQLDGESHNTILNISQLPNGIYLLLYHTQLQTYSGKFIIQKQ